MSWPWFTFCHRPMADGKVWEREKEHKRENQNQRRRGRVFILVMFILVKIHLIRTWRNDPQAGALENIEFVTQLE